MECKKDWNDSMGALLIGVPPSSINRYNCAIQRSRASKFVEDVVEEEEEEEDEDVDEDEEVEEVVEEDVVDSESEEELLELVLVDETDEVSELSELSSDEDDGELCRAGDAAAATSVRAFAAEVLSVCDEADPERRSTPDASESASFEFIDFN
ncbi:unnamed protein product [Echinostoma caproni]|uniref:Uncharacterized protein n=1 Tax=Echinostoma caproni TaxID=27848 RepID=A0A183AND9_9TREM|nr:unnamed protein product [Echinostoma caproni]